MERGDSERIEITISSRFENIELVQVIAEHLCENAGVDEDGSHWIGMAVREAVANAIKHGNKSDLSKRVIVEFSPVPAHDPSELVIRVQDEGEGFEPEEVADPLAPENLLKSSGRGIFLIRSFMDDVEHRKVPEGGMEIRMTKKVPKNGTPDS